MSEIEVALMMFVTKAGNQSKAAKELRISGAYLSDILRGKRDISDKIANALGFSREVIFVKKQFKYTRKK